VDFSLSRTGMNPLRDGLDMLRLAILLRRLRVDMSLGYFIKPVNYGTLAGWLAGVPRRLALIEGLGYVFTPSGERLSWKRRALRRAVTALFRLALGHVERVIFLNEDDLAQFVEGGLVAAEKTVVICGIGVDLAEWPSVRPVVEPVTFLLAARLLREKGIVEYAKAARRVKARYPQARFILLGGLDPNPGGLSRAEVQAWVAEGLLEWPGHVEVKPWLAQASVYVLPSYREGVPRSTQEALAMGRPVITTDAPGCRETVVEGENGYLVPVRDVDTLVERMIRFIEEPALIETMGQAARRLAEERFDVRRINARILEILGIAPVPAPASPCKAE
jgi:glycosyltransferase involved in cell wall biosynthesis